MQRLELDSKGLLYIDIMELPINSKNRIWDGKTKFRELPTHREYKVMICQGEF